MLQLEYKSHSLQSWVQGLQNHFEASVDQTSHKTCLSVPDGYVEARTLMEGLDIAYIDFLLKEDIIISRLINEADNKFIFTFNLSHFELLSAKNESDKPVNGSQYGVMLYSPIHGSSFRIRKNQRLIMFVIEITKPFIAKYILGNSTNQYKEAISNIFFAKSPKYFYRRLNESYRKILIKIAPGQMPSNLIMLKITTELIDKVIESIAFPENEEVNFNFDRIDYLAVNNAIEKINTDLSKRWNNDELAKESGMSLSKFKIVFKRLVGTSPYQYQLHNKMTIAAEYIMKGKSTAEVALIMGYSNTSKFSEAFKKIIGSTPAKLRRKMS